MSDMQVSAAAWLERVVESTDGLLRLQPEASLHQMIIESASMILEASGAALFLVDGDSAVLTAVTGACTTLPLGLRLETSALVRTPRIVKPVACVNSDAAPDILSDHSPALVMPLRTGSDVLAIVWIPSHWSETGPSDAMLPLDLFARQAAVALQNARENQRVVATVAHELRNPLGAIVNALHLLERFGAPDARVLELRQLIGRQTKHLTRLVEDVLDLARLRHGKLRLETERLDLRDVVRVVVDTIRASGRAADRDVRDDLGSEALFVTGDRTRLEQVVRNLVDNAVKYSQPGTAIIVSIATDGSDASLRVRDDGLGIAADMLPRLFEAFAQAEAAGHRAAGGLGLGLPLVRAIVEQHGGTITAHSDGLGKGSEFVVRLPRWRSDGRRLPDQAARAPEASRSESRITRTGTSA